jgi:hypothetical protein
MRGSNSIGEIYQQNLHAAVHLMICCHLFVYSKFAVSRMILNICPQSINPPFIYMIVALILVAI